MKSKLILLLLILAQGAVAQEIPKHLELARELLATVKPENNRYVAINSTSGVRWKGDFLTSENVVYTACGGFVGAVLERAKVKSYDEIRSRATRGEVRVASFIDGVHRGYGPKKVASLFDAEPGDIFLFECLKNDCKAQGYLAAGHVALIDAKPWQRRDKYSEPLIEGTLQWVVVVIDSDEHPHDITDTRYSPDGKHQTGVGRGKYRVYTDMNGVPVGYTNGFSKKYFSKEDRFITISRP